ncbi:MAG: ParA family protein, partial [Bacillota bacterium]
MILAITNQKGGIGKTTTCLNLGAIAAALGNKRTCLIDLDPQGNLTKTLIQPGQISATSYEALRGEPIQASLHRTNFPNLCLVPSGLSLAGLERTAAHDPRLPYRLREAMPHSFLQDF